MDKRGEMEQVAGVFDLYKFPKTAEVIRSLSNDLYVTRVKIDFEKALREIRRILKMEFVSSSANASFGRKLYSDLTALENSAFKANATLKGKRLKGFYSSMVRIRNSYDVIGDVASNFMGNEKLTIRQQYYAECFMYLLIVEGVFKELCEYVLMLVDIERGRSRSFSEIERLDLYDLVKEIRSNSDVSIFVEGYGNHLRNSIAHANFRFDENTQEMSFRDEYKGKATPLPSLKIRDFAQYYLKIDDVYRLITSFWEILRLVTIYAMG
jgi:hypothetical protein